MVWASVVAGELSSDLLLVCITPVRESTQRSLWARAGSPSFLGGIALQWEWNGLLSLALVHLSRKYPAEEIPTEVEMGHYSCAPHFGWQVPPQALPVAKTASKRWNWSECVAPSSPAGASQSCVSACCSPVIWDRGKNWSANAHQHPDHVLTQTI